MIFFRTVLGLLGLIVVIGTIYDVFVIHRFHASHEYDHLEESEPLIPGSQENNSSRNIKFRGYNSIPAEGDGQGQIAKSNIQEGDEIGISEIGIALLCIFFINPYPAGTESN